MSQKSIFKQEDGLSYLLASKSLPQEGMVPQRVSVYQSEYDKKFFSYINSVQEKKFSRSNWPCSRFTKGLYDALGLNSLYGEITNNFSDSQYKELIKISPNISGSTFILSADALENIQEGMSLNLTGVAQGTITSLRKFQTGAVFSVGGKRYVAQLVSRRGGQFVALGEAGEWDKNYPSGTYNLKTINGKEHLAQKYLQIKLNDENLAQKQLEKIYDVIISSKGEKEFLALGYENSLLLNYRHSVFYKSVYRISNPMQINDNSLQVEDGNLIGQLQNLFSNMPANATQSKPYFDDEGKMHIDFSWEKTSYLNASKPRVKCKFSAQLVLDINPQTNFGKAYYLEEVRHNAGIDGDLQGAKLIPLIITPDGEGFRLEFNHLMMFENVDSEDLTHRIGAGTINAHIIYPQMLKSNFRPQDNLDFSLLSIPPGEEERYSKWVYGSGRYNFLYALGDSKFSHLITGNLIPAQR